MLRLRSILLLSTLIPLAACGPQDTASPGEGTIVVPVPGAPAPPPPPPPAGNGTPAAACPQGTVDRGVIATAWRNCEMSGRINDDYTVQKLPGVIYSLAGPVNVGTDVGGDGALAGGDAVTLTVQAGVTIFGSSGNDYLVINRGSRINAVGNATQPIIFTARANVEGTATDSTQGLWGGVILLGRAPISDCNTAVPGGSAACQQVIEGTTGSFYGGNLATDNSGTMRFVQIRYSGFAIAPGNELQGLTMGGVGNNSTIDHIQIHNSSDDGIEIFGGRVNAKHLVVTGADDDGLDTDLGYRGTIQFVIGVQRDGQNGDSMIEADSNGNEDALPRQYTRVSNATFVQRSTVQGGNTILLRGGTDYALINSIVVGPQACLDIDATSGTTIRAADNALQDIGPPIFRSVALACPTPFRDDGNVTVAEIQAIFGSGSNGNVSNFTSTLMNIFVNGGNETGVAATDPTSFNADQFATVNAAAPNRLEAAAYVGAVRNAADTWYSGWTCNAGYASFGNASGNCTAVPTS
ncbi:MAG TPA: hypothetical protein VF605_15015 [Allosphingosinicella sp.]|jgi:hypothetical protein